MATVLEKRDTKRRGRDEGSIYQRGDGRWVASVSGGVCEKTGKRRRVVVYGVTKADAQDKLAAKLEEKRKGLLNAGAAAAGSVAEYLDQWLVQVRLTRKPETAHSYEGTVKRYIKPHVGQLKLAKLRASHINGMLEALRHAGKSPRVVQLTYTVLRVALEQAAAGPQPLLPFNPCAGIKRPKLDHREISPYTLEQARTIIKTAPARYKALFQLAISTGMRQGELFGLKWEDIDLANGVLTVNRTLTEVRGSFAFGAPKTRAGRRRITLDDATRQSLIDHRQLMQAEGLLNQSPTVFCNESGGFLSKSNSRQRVWLPLLKKAKLPIRRFHDLRHTAASLMIQANVHPKAMQTRLGHADISVTLNTYGHLFPGTDQQTAAAVGALLAG